MKSRGHTIKAAISRPAAYAAVGAECGFAAGAFPPDSAERPTIRQGGKL